MIYVITEEKYSETTWCERITGGIEQQSRAKRIKAQFGNDRLIPDEAEAIIVVGTTPSWIYRTVGMLKEKYKSFIILVSNRPYSLSVSNVCSDLYSAVREVLIYLNSCGKERIALYGVNPSSTADNIKLSAFDRKEAVYYNLGDLRDCCRKFTEAADRFDAVICTNDFAAVSLISYLKKHSPNTLDRLFTVSFANTHLGRINNPSVTSVELNFEEYGKAAVDIFRMLKKNPNLQTVNISVKSEIVVRATTDNIPVKDGFSYIDGGKGKDVSFYEDEEIKEMVKIEKVFENCSESDITVINMLTSGQSYENAAEKCFMTVNGIKYRLDRLCRICGFESRSELIAAMKNAIRELL